MERSGYRDRSRRQKPKETNQKEGRAAHFQTVCFGGFDETQMICYLWDTVKSIEAVEAGGEKEVNGLKNLKRQLHGRIRVEMRRYFLRKKRRDMKLAAVVILFVAVTVVFFGFLAGVDRVSGNSMYPYLNNGDWIVYSRLAGEMKRQEVVVFKKNGENLVKRIAGLPGDTVQINASGSRVSVNGVQMREEYVTLTDSQNEELQNEMGAPLTVMNSQYLVLGDNRAVSLDSRDSNIGTVAADEVLGRVILIIRAGS